MPTVTIEVELPDTAPAETLNQLKKDIHHFAVARAALISAEPRPETLEADASNPVTADKRLAGRVGQIRIVNPPPEGKAWSELEEAA